ncbi:hypothetical protein SLEP1_g31662 [Rubroshorea leprosula]|uniref:Uncharacterized protein n=1 Tax=Rubroshorea leprosula TaxID=152421 RepID=A0AAV5K3Z6_9ROSI|nr:hypothetical protein SLEP1_g31662 [Rubroshorea leprosula]
MRISGHFSDCVILPCTRRRPLPQSAVWFFLGNSGS